MNEGQFFMDLDTNELSANQIAERPQIRIEFGFSSSSNYDRAVEIAQELTGYTSQGEGRRARHQIAFRVVEEVDELLRLMDLVQKWKSYVIWLGDKESQWHANWVLYCIQRRIHDYDPPAYCDQDNYWGCQRCPIRLTTGDFDKDGAFHFDKERFLFEEKESLEALAACPFFDQELFLSRLDQLDEVIDPRTSQIWDYGRGYSDEIVGVSYVPQTKRTEIEFASLEERGEKAWRTRIISIPDEEWMRHAETGHISEVDALLEEGWRLVSVVDRGEVWYCVLER